LFLFLLSRLTVLVLMLQTLQMPTPLVAIVLGRDRGEVDAS